MLLSRTLACIVVHRLTMPATMWSSSASASAAMSCFATAASASGGHGENQSMVVLLMSEGNWRMRLRYSSPSGLIAITTWRCFLTILTNME